MEIFDFSYQNLEKMVKSKDVDGLMKTFKYGDIFIKRYIAMALGGIGGKLAVEALTQALKDKDSTVRSCAAMSLGKIGDPAIEPLIHTLKNGDRLARMNAVIALGEIGGKLAVEALTQALKDKDSTVRSFAKEVLEKIKHK